MGLWVFLVFSCFFLGGSGGSFEGFQWVCGFFWCFLVFFGGSGGSFEGFQWVCGFFWCFLVFFWEVLVVLLRVFNGFEGFSGVFLFFFGRFWWFF